MKVVEGGSDRELQLWAAPVYIPSLVRRRLTGCPGHEILCGVEGADGIVPGRKIRYGGGSVTVAAEDPVSGWVVGPGTAVLRIF